MTAKKVDGLMRSAIEAGATLRCGGEIPEDKAGSIHRRCSLAFPLTLRSCKPRFSGQSPR
ncbi:succinate-semialdehyde dehydrogenase [Cutibacterium acnes JCM 18916]|nr:succinate-semialdehyde dehydrogenase [Cutibacterium acnes JCM 18916]